MGSRLRRPALYVGSLLLLFLVGYVDYITGPEIGMSLFYFGPIMLCGWFFYRQRASAIVLPIMAAGIWLAAEIFGGAPAAGTWIPYWNAFIRLGMFLIVSLMISRLREANARERVLSRTDALTGVFNSRYFEELVHAEIARSARFSALTFRTPPASWAEVVKVADALMYQAKKGGKDRIAFDVVG